MLHLLGLRDDRIMFMSMTDNIRFRTLHIPEQSFRIEHWGTKTHGAIYRAIAANAPETKPCEKIYLSRVKLKQARVCGEKRIQQIFEKNGYRVVYPETMSVTDQIALVKNCKYLAGCAGTALHLSGFMPAGGTVILLKRNTSASGSLDTQTILNAEADINNVFVWASIEKRPSPHFSPIPYPQIIGVNQYVREFFDAAGFKYDRRDLRTDYGAWFMYRMDMLRYRWKTFIPAARRAVYATYCAIIRQIGHILTLGIRDKARRRDARKKVEKFMGA